MVDNDPIHDGNVIDDAARQGKMQALYQPVVSTGENKVCWHEALMRPQKDRMDNDAKIDTEDFYQLAEAFGMTLAIAEWVLRESARLPGPVSFNVSGNEIEGDSPLLGVVAETLEKKECQPGDLIMEITERSPLTRDSLQVLEPLRDQGMKVAIDDFGAGHSTLALLVDATDLADIIKLDKDFVRVCLSSTRLADRCLLGDMIANIRDRGLTVVAEGIESAKDFETVRELGSEFAQGFHLGKPQPIG